MLAFFTICWVFSIWSMFAAGDAGGRSVTFDLACLIGYGFGITAHAASIGAAWLLDLTSQIYLGNMVMVCLDLAVIIAIRATRRKVRALI